MKKPFLLFVFLLYITNAFSQLTIKKSESVVQQKNVNYSTRYRVVNETQDTFYVWIIESGENHDYKNPFRDYFLSNLNYGSLSFLCWDRNIANLDRFIPKIGFNFLKRMCPNETFDIFVLNRDMSLSILSESITNIRKIVSIDILDKYTYPSDYVIVQKEDY